MYAILPIWMEEESMRPQRPISAEQQAGWIFGDGYSSSA